MGRSRATASRRDRTLPKVQRHKKLYFEHTENMRNSGLLCTDAERAERIRDVLEALYEVNKRIPIVVEGRRDVQALRRIGMVGDIITIHAGKGLYDLCEDIAERFHRVILLLDWDEKGEDLFRTISGNLKGLWEEFAPFRDLIRILCQKEIKDIEGMPGLLERLAGTEVTVRQPEDPPS